MQRLIPILFTLLLVPSAAQAQGVKLGIRAGGNFATFRGDTEEALEFPGTSSEFERRTALQIGGFFQFAVSDQFTIQPELIYTQKGSSLDGSVSVQGQVVDFSGTFRFSYLEIPVLAKFQIPTTGSLKPSIFAGPALGFNLTSEFEIEAGGESETDDDVDVSSTELGVVIGGELAYILASGNAISLDIRYNPGITDVDSEGDESLQNDIITVGLSYTFSLGTGVSN